LLVSDKKQEKIIYRPKKKLKKPTQTLRLSSKSATKVTLEEVFHTIRSPKGSTTVKDKLSAVGFHPPSTNPNDIKQTKNLQLADRSLTAATTARSTDRQVIV
jgi:hypothetical protein